MKRLAVKLSAVLAGLVLFATVVIGCLGLPFPVDPEMFTAKGYFEEAPPELATYEVSGRTIRYAATGDERRPTVLFVHGSPGSWENFARFLDDDGLQQRARLVAVDRPGFGGSRIGGPERSLAKQAAVLEPLIDRSAGPVVLVGHSYGGAVAVRAALDHPDRGAGLILVAPAIDPELEELPWYQHVGNWRVVRWALPRLLDTSNQEVLALRRELEALRSELSRLEVPVTVIQGERDRLVSPANADYVERELAHLEPEVVRLPEGDHFIPWRAAGTLRRAILAHLERAERRSRDTPRDGAPAAAGKDG